MFAVSLWQPWATLCFLSDPVNAGRPPKEWETRPYTPPAKVLGQRIALCSTIGVPASVRADLCIRGRFRTPYAEILERCGASVLDPWSPTYLARVKDGEIPILNGRAIGSAIVRGSRPTDLAAEWIAAGKRLNAIGKSSADWREAIAVEYECGNYEEGRHAWQLEAAIPVVPAPAVSGMQRVWTLPEERERIVLRSVAARRPGLESALR